MCEKNEFKTKTDAFDRELLAFFERWRSFVRLYRDELTLEHTNWLEEFCSYVWDSLVCFDKIDWLSEPLESRGDESTKDSNKMDGPLKEKVHSELLK